MAPTPTPSVPTVDEVHANLQTIPVVTGKPEQFAGPANSGPPSIAGMPQYEGLDMQSKSVQPNNFDSFDHSALVANVEPIQSASVDAFRREWATASNTVTDTFETFSSKIGRAIADKWTGPAGESASAAIVGYANDSYSMATASNLVARQVGLLSDSLSNTKTNLPSEPAATVPDKILSFLGDDGWDEERREEAKQQAVQLLNTVYYGSGISPTAQAMPMFPEVHPPGADSPGRPASGPTGTPSIGLPGTGDGGGGGGAPGTPGSPTADEGAPAQPESPTGEQPTSESPTGPASDQALGSEGTGSPESLGSPTNPSTAGTSAAGMPGMGAGGGGVGSGGGAGGGVGSGGGAGGGLGAGGIGGGAGSGGSAGPGALGAPNAGGTAAGGAPMAAAGGAGRAGSPGMGMGPMGGARGAGQGGDKDEEHKTPDYLRNDELSQWVGAQGDRAYAPVIGAQRPRPSDETGSKK